MELRNAVSARFGTELPATATFDHPTVAALAVFVASRIGPQANDGAESAWQPEDSAAAAQHAAAAAQDVQRRLQEAVDELLGFAVAPDMPLMEAGLDSISAHILPILPQLFL